MIINPTHRHTVHVYYEDSTGERPIDVTLYRDGREAVIETDLSDVPDDEIESVKHRAREQFWALEQAAVRPPREGGFPGHDDDA